MDESQLKPPTVHKGTQDNKVNSINQLLLLIFPAHLNVILYHLHGGRQSLCLSPAVKCLIWTQLDTADYIPRQITLQAVDKILAISSQFKNKSHLSGEIKTERRTWHQQQKQRRLIDMELNVPVRGQEIVSLRVAEKSRRVFVIPIGWHWRIQWALSYKIASWEGISGDGEVEREGGWLTRELWEDLTWAGFWKCIL